MEFIITQETEDHFSEVENLIVEAFKDDQHSDHQEHKLVERLRDSSSFIPELSLVAKIQDKVVGYIMLTKIKITNPQQSFNSLALAPVAVLPAHQGKGVGSALINQAHSIARSLGYGSVVLLGHADYYPKFGYTQCDGFGITMPFEVPSEYCMALELTPDALKGVSGVVEYDPAFGI